MALEHVNYKFVGPPNKVRIFVHYSYTQVELGKFGWSYTLGTMRRNHCSPWYYLLKTLLIPISPPLEKTIHNNTWTWTFTHNILSGSYRHYSYFVPVLVSSQENKIVEAHVRC